MHWQYPVKAQTSLGPPFTHNCGARQWPSHGQIAGPMLGSAPHFCAFTHENSAAAEPRYFVQCDLFRRAWRSTCKQTLHVNNVYGLAFGPACVYTKTGRGSAMAGPRPRQPVKLGQKRPRIWPRILSFVRLHTNRAAARPRLGRGPLLCVNGV